MTSDPMIELVDNTTGERFTGNEMLDEGALESIATEMKRRVNLLLLPFSLFFEGSEFRQFVKDFTAQHGTPPKYFTIGEIEMPLPKYWPEDAIFGIVPADWSGRYHGEAAASGTKELTSCRKCGEMM